MAIIKDLGSVTPYAKAVEQGYTGTEAEWYQVQLAAAQNAQDAQTAAQSAAADAAAAAASKAEVTAEGATQVAAVRAKGTEVLNSIPADYTALTGEVSDLKNDLIQLDSVVLPKLYVEATERLVYYPFDVSAGTKVRIVNSDNVNYPSYWGALFYNSNKEFIESRTVLSTESDVEYTIVNNGIAYFRPDTNFQGRATVYAETGNSLKEKIAENTAKLSELAELSELTYVDMSIGKANSAYINRSYYDTTGYFTTNRVDVSPGIKIVYISHMATDTLSNVFLDNLGRVVAYYTRTSAQATALGNDIYRFELIVPDNAVAFIGSCANASLSTISMVTAPTGDFYAEVNDIAAETNDIASKLNELYVVTNLLDPSKLIGGKYILNTGAEGTSATWSATDYILLEPNTKYYIGGFYTKENYAFYDLAGNPISSKTFGDIQITTTSTDADTQSQFGYFTTGADKIYIRLSEPTAWIAEEPYLSKVDEYKIPGLDVSGIAKDHEARISELETSSGAGSPLRGKRILVIGDSISTETYHTIGVPAWDKWATVLSKKYHFTLTNDSVHATGWVADTSTQDRSKTFPKRIVQHTSAETYDMIVIFGGVNDHIQGSPFGTDSDTDWDTYILASMKYCLDYLINTFPTAQIVAILPLQYNRKNNVVNGLNLEGYVEKMKEVYDDYSVATLDLFHEGGFRAWNATFNERFGMLAGSADPAQQVHDGLHPNQEWDNNYLAPQIYNFLINQFMN